MARPEDNLNSIAVCQVPNNFKQRFEYYGDGTIKYAGHAIKGSSESSTVWTIQYFQNNATPATISIDIYFNGAWTLRDTYTYE